MGRKICLGLIYWMGSNLIIERCGCYPGSATPGYEIGMLRIPQECASDGCGGERFNPVRI